MQDYRNFPLYLTGDLWNLLQSRDHSISQLRKVEQLCGFLVTSLGLRHASETTQSVLVSVVARQMDPVQQSNVLQTIKSVLRTATTRARQVGTPLPGNHYLVQLPASQEELPDAFRVHVQTLGIVPVPAELDLAEILQAARAIPLRSRNQQLVLQHAVQGRLPQGSASVGCMQTMALQQQLVTQTATMMAAAFSGVMGARDAEMPLTNLRLLAPGSETTRAGAGSQGLQQLMDRAGRRSSAVGGEASSVAVAEAPSSSQPAVPMLALGNGSVQDLDGVSASAAEPVETPAKPEQRVVAALPGTANVSEPGVAFSNLQVAATAAQGSLAPATASAVLEQKSSGTEIPSHVSESVQNLANAHYQKCLPEQTSSMPAKGKGRGKGRVKTLKKPAASTAALKKPAAAQVAQQGASDHMPAQSSKERASMKRPAAAAGSKSSKKCSAVTSGSQSSKKAVKILKPLSEKERFKRKPKGCSRCRRTPGCCPSCWAKKGFLVK